jgi:hypothetical protein
MGAVLGPYLPQPPIGSASPSRWGDAEAVSDLLGSHPLSVRLTRLSSLLLSFADCTEARQFLIRTAGHVLVERARLERDGRWTDLESELEQLIRDRNRAAGDAVELECEYLVVLADANG